MKRVTILLTEAQVKLLRGAVRSHMEDMSIAGLWTETDIRMAENILAQLDQNPLREVTR